MLPGKAPAMYASKGPVSTSVNVLLIPTACDFHQETLHFWWVTASTDYLWWIPDSHKTIPEGFRRWKSFCCWERAGSSNVLACSTVQRFIHPEFVTNQNIELVPPGACRLMGD